MGDLEAQGWRSSALIAGAGLFVSEPISLAFLIASVLLLIVVAAPSIRAKREQALQE